MKKFSIYIFIILLVGLISPMFVAEASPEDPKEACILDDGDNVVNLPCVHNGIQENRPGTYILLAPVDVAGGITDFDPSDKGALGRYLNIMIKIIIGVSAILAVVMIVMGGLEYMTSELVHSKEAGKEKVTGALLGLLIALSAFILLGTINPELLTSTLKVEEEVIKVTFQDVPQECPPGGTCGGYATGSNWAQIAGSATVLPSWVGKNNNNRECINVGDRNCTSTRGLAMGNLETIHTKCPACVLIVTGGTETWLHSRGSSHRPGSTTVDLRPNINLNNYILSGRALQNGQRYEKDGISYMYEVHDNIEHWHVGP